jgi:DNA processing protein
MNDRDAYIVLNMMQGVGPVSVRALALHLGSVAAIFSASAADLQAAPEVGREIINKICEQRTRLDPVREVARAAELEARIITPVDAEYPRPLIEIYDPPLAMYVQGTLESRDRHAIAVVGSRHTTHYGLECAERLAQQLAQNGFTVVSGLARGIDTAAHQGALKGQGRTLAILGGALDQFYPPENRALGQAIAHQGAVLSEFLLGREPDRTTFPMRNRIISGLALGVLVVEADLTSGAMITARQALEQGRAVFAVPGRIDTPTSTGPHALIKGGAKLVANVEDILEEFQNLLPQVKPGHIAPDRPCPPLGAEEQRLMAVLEKEDPLDVDALTRQAGLSAAAASALLMTLEMKRIIRMLPGRMVARVRR